MSPPSSSNFDNQYFRQPRHSSTREKSTMAKTPATCGPPSASGASSKASSNVARTSFNSLSSPLSSSRSDTIEDDWHDTHSVPLGPRWHDYTYREGDAFYGASLGQETLPSGIVETAALTETIPAPGSLLQSVSSAMSILRHRITSTLYTWPVKPQSTGFEVVRPARVLSTHSGQSDDSMGDLGR